MQSQYEETTHEEFFVTTSMKEIELDIYTTKVYLFNGKRIKNHYIITNIRHLARAKRFLKQFEDVIKEEKNEVLSFSTLRDSKYFYRCFNSELNDFFAKTLHFKIFGHCPTDYERSDKKTETFIGMDHVKTLTDIHEVLEPMIETYDKNADEYIKEIQPDHKHIDFTPLLYKKQTSTEKSAAKTS